MISGNDDALDEEDSALPQALLEPIRQHVQAYLAGRTLTDDEKRCLGKAATVPGLRTLDERLQDLERLHDEGYLGTREYEARGAEIIEVFMVSITNNQFFNNSVCLIFQTSLRSAIHPLVAKTYTTEFSPAQRVSGPVGFPSFLPRALSFFPSSLDAIP